MESFLFNAKNIYRFTVILFRLILVCMLIFVGLLKYWEKDGRYAPYQLKVVLSGSMADTYPQDSLLLIKQVTPEAVQLNDVITFETANQVVTHRVMKMAQETPQKFVTKGDNNRQEDRQLVGEEELIGKVIIGLPKLGRFLLILQTKIGKLALVLTIIEVFLIKYWLSLLLNTTQARSTVSAT